MKIQLLLVLAIFTTAVVSLTPVAKFQIDKVLNVDLNAVVYNNVNDTWASDCLGMYFRANDDKTQIFMNTTLWAKPKPENFTLTVTKNPAVWQLNTLNVVWVYADYKKEVYGFADELGMTTYILSPSWNVPKLALGEALYGLIKAGVTVQPQDMVLAPDSCHQYP